MTRGLGRAAILAAGLVLGLDSPSRSGGDLEPTVALAAHAADADEIEDVMPTGQRLADEFIHRRTHRADGKAARRAVLVLERAARTTMGANSRQGLRGRHVQANATPHSSRMLG